MARGRRVHLFYVLSRGDAIGVRRYDRKNLVIFFDAINKDMGIVVSHELFYTLSRVGICMAAYSECLEGRDGLDAECSPLWKDCLVNDQTFLGILEEMIKENKDYYEKTIGAR